jgi:AcrR family transcriptional regulator
LVTDTRPLRADAKRNRDNLLDAATQAFAEDGQDVALEVIAARAGVGIGTLYRHFPNRNALVEEAYRHEVDALCSSAPTLLATLAPDLALHAWMERFAQYVVTKRGMGEALRSAVASDSPLFSHTRDKIVGALALLLEAGAAGGSLRGDVDPEDVMRAMSAVWHLPMGPGWQDHVRRLLDLLVDGLRYGAAGQAASA